MKQVKAPLLNVKLKIQQNASDTNVAFGMWVHKWKKVALEK